MISTDPRFHVIRDRILRPGAVETFAADDDVFNAIVAVDTAKKDGHAVVYDEIYSGGKFVTAHVLHYKTCKRCEEEKNVN